MDRSEAISSQKVTEKSRLSVDWLKFAVQGFTHLLKKTALVISGEFSFIAERL